MIGSLAKPSRTARMKLAKETKAAVIKTEAANKRTAKARDKHRCRFPLCRCSKIGYRLESAHGFHKGMGGDPAGNRSEVDNLITFCIHRHQFGSISLHKGTLRVVPLTARGFSGACEFVVDVSAMTGAVEATWMAVGRESAVGVFDGTYYESERKTLLELAKMEV